MNAQEAAERLRPSFKLEAMPAEDRHHVKFVEDVATALGIEHSHFNLHQVADAVDRAGIEQDSNEYPKMLYSRQHHAVKAVGASMYDPRHDHVWTVVADEEQAAALPEGWVDDIAKLPPRGEIPLHAVAPIENAPQTEAPLVPLRTLQGGTKNNDPEDWDPLTAAIKRADGSIDKVATNEERSKRGIALLA